MLLFYNAAQIVQVVCQGERFLAGPAQSRPLAILEHASLLADPTHGTILAVGPNASVLSFLSSLPPSAQGDLRRVDCTHKVLLPGFVDAHTHPVWDGDRSHEFRLKLRGARYLEVQQSGGGIAHTTRATCAASEERLLALLRHRQRRMLALGTTTMEGKSGYGLEAAAELKMLRVLHRAGGAVSVVSTFCGAHGVPNGVSADAAVRDVVEVQLPAVLRERREGRNDVRQIDVFCETGVFDAAQARRVLQAGRDAGLALHFHGDELSFTGAAELAGDLGAEAVSHLEHISDAGIAAMRRKPTFAVLLPMTAYVLRLKMPPARRILEGGVPIALGSDFCPNAHVLSMPHTMNVACVMMEMSLEEAMVAATINAAGCLGMSEKVGSLETGKWADVILLDAPSWEHVVYQMVDPPIEAVYKKGKLVHTRPKLLEMP